MTGTCDSSGISMAPKVPDRTKSLLTSDRRVARNAVSPPARMLIAVPPMIWSTSNRMDISANSAPAAAPARIASPSAA